MNGYLICLCICLSEQDSPPTHPILNRILPTHLVYIYAGVFDMRRYLSFYSLRNTYLF